jgi:hypothetical protein
MGSFAELDPYTHLSRLGDFIKKASQTFGFSVRGSFLSKTARLVVRDFKRWNRINLSSFEISYLVESSLRPDLHPVTHFMECSTTKDGTGNCLADISTIMDAKEFALLLFFMLHRELLLGVEKN